MTDLSEALRTSPATVRRDITEMDEKGLVERTWGGVRLVGDLDDPFQEALASHGKGKQGAGGVAVRPAGGLNYTLLHLAPVAAGVVCRAAHLLAQNRQADRVTG